MSPSLLGFRLMIKEQDIAEIVNAYLRDTDQFVVDIKVTPQNKIVIYLDGDSGVTIEDCSKLSRHVESHLDREAEDFELQVSSVGVGQPLQLNRQFKNNIGRRLAITDKEDKSIKGRLADVTEKGVVIEKDREKKGKKKKKEPDTDANARLFIAFDDIKEAKVQVSFR